MVDLKIRVAVFLLAAFFVGCAGDGTSLGPDGAPLVADDVDNGDGNGETDANNGGDNGVTITLKQLSDEIFTPNCTSSGCHGGSFVAANMSLVAERIADEIIGVTSTQSNLNRIEPGDPEASYLFKKVRGDRDVNSQMPLNRSPLTPDQIEMIRAWITAGAPVE